MRFDLELMDFVECEKDFDNLAVCGSNEDLTWKEFKDKVEILKK